MSMMGDFFGGFVEGLVSGAANPIRNVPGNGRRRGRIESLAQELGWSVDERDGSAVKLHFRAADGEVRKVRISNGDEAVVGFYAHSNAVLPARDVSPRLLVHLLECNLGDCIGMWGIAVDDENDVTFHLCYMALGDGLDAATLQYICESLSSEASALDDKLRAAGLLD